MKPIKYSLTKQIADAIEQNIQSGEYNIGDKIPTEPQLVDHFGASRNTVREAVQSLIHAGILEARQGDGTYVMAKERLQVDFFSLMNKIKIEDILEVRNLLEKHIVESAALQATQEDLLYIETCLHKRNNYSHIVRENTEADMAFHRAISQATHNQLLIHLYQYVSQYFNEHIAERLTSHKQQQNEIDALHTQLFVSIRKKDGNCAQELIAKIINL